MRFWRDGPAYNEHSNAYVNGIYTSTFDGHTSKAFYDLSGETPWRVGFVLKRDENQDCDNYHLRPMMLFCMPISLKYSLFRVEANWKMANTTREIQGKPCRAIVNGGQAYWFDPSRGNAVLLYESSAQGVVLLRQEIFYRDDPKYGPIPRRWTSVAYRRDGVVSKANSVTVMSYEMNGEYYEENFDITFPAETEVRDDRVNRFYRLEKDGTKHDIVR